MCEWGNDVVLRLPDWMLEHKERRTACVDECIVDQIKALWAAGYTTEGCCCGHGKEPPSVVIADGHSDEDVEGIVRVLRESDSRSWAILQWRIQTVATTRT